jgi:hypothetical protein
MEAIPPLPSSVRGGSEGQALQSHNFGGEIKGVHSPLAKTTTTPFWDRLRIGYSAAVKASSLPASLLDSM